MRRVTLMVALLTLAMACQAAPPEPKFKKVQLSDKFYCEGAYSGDFNKDGKLDVVSGPFWYEGPAFEKKHMIWEVWDYKPVEFNYSENFLTYTGDFNGDGWLDILRIRFPGKDAYWYENPKGKDKPWDFHLAARNVGNESPVWGDINGDGRPDLIYNINGAMGYATWDPAKPNDTWTFHAVTTREKRYMMFTHGIGYGDINGDGRTDLVEAVGWWEQPAKPENGKPWIFHKQKFADAGAQMLVYDVDGDGLNDVITAWHCHKYGLVWQKQVRGEGGQITWQQNVIIPIEPDSKSITQLHAFDLVDMNNDGLKDFVTGKRFMAHPPKTDPGWDAPAVLYWFELRRDKQKGGQFIPHMIDDNSGVGTQVATADLNGDSYPDVIVGNKKGTFLFLSQPGK